jgi:hypothetical protein
MPWQTGQVIVALSSLDGAVAFTGFSLSSQPLRLTGVIDTLTGDTAALPHTDRRRAIVAQRRAGGV